MKKPPINLIAAMANNRVIGKDNKMPWHLPADLKHFKQVTMRHPIVMGRKTFESIGRALPGRRNIVISRNPNLTLAGAEVFNSIDSALDSCAEQGAEEIMIIGGSNLYAQTLALADRLYLTFIDLDVAGDAHFPNWQDLTWQETTREAHGPDDNNPYNYEFVTFERVTNT
ncbi:MAG: type 3 dihydrofolate reductase [Gammaproteobacteria bacterium]|nr:type 3 dihydrofolate reductase [Gammaproteobacteria bacterium]NNJ73341.1 type 3 dihydrofolate reductase [Enterobacterales bacterium]